MKTVLGHVDEDIPLRSNCARAAEPARVVNGKNWSYYLRIRERRK